MKMTERLALIAVLATTSHAFVERSPGQAPTVYAFTNVSVLAMDGERLAPDQTVIVRGDRIEDRWTVGDASPRDRRDGGGNGTQIGSCVSSASCRRASSTAR